METVKISYPDFLKIINTRTNQDFAIPMNKYVYNFMMRYPNQNNVYEIEDVVNDKRISKEIDSATIQYLTRFGIKFASSNLESLNSGLNILTDRQYVVIINRYDKFGLEDDELITADDLANFNDSESDILADDTCEKFIEEDSTDITTAPIRNDAAIDSFIEDNIPIDASPSWYIDMRKFKDSSEIESVLEAMRGKFPNINSMLSYNELKQRKDKRAVIESEIQANLDIYSWLEVVDITDVVDRIYDRVNGTNIDSHKLFTEQLDAFAKTLNRKSFVVYYGKSMNDYILCAAYLTYFHKANCFVSSDKVSYFYNILGQLFYNEETMLVEDKIKYLLNFPTFTFRISDYTVSFIGTRTVSVLGDVQLCPVDSSMRSTNFELNASEVKKQLNFNFAHHRVISIFDYFKLDSTDKEILKLEELSLRKLIINFERVLNLDRLKLLNICDIFFVNIGGQTFIGYLEKLKFKTDSTLVADAMFSVSSPRNSADFEFSITENEVSAYLPLDILVDGDIGVKKIQMADPRFKTADNRIIIGSYTTGNIQINAAERATSKYAIPIRYYYTAPETTSILEGLDWEVFHDIGMYSPECYAYRTDGAKVLLSFLSRRQLRDNSTLISAYGGYHILVSGGLDLTENMIRGDLEDVRNS